jgi:peptidoglycan/LPS O-acetylase OafA/YrhL
MSYENSGTVILYFEKRLRRIYPAYLAIVLLCALLGFFLSSYSFTEYYLSRTFMRYIAANVFFLNFLEPGLPGVFVSNHLGAINGSLWTIRTEVLCYVLVPFLVYFLRRYNRLAVFLLMYTGAYIVYALLLKNAHSAVHPYLVKMYYVPWHFLCFMSGAVCYYFSDTFRSRPVLFLLPALVLYIGGWTANITILEPVSLAVLVVSAACFFPYLGNFARFGDMSYGVYIFHFPIVQILISRSIFNTSPIFGLIIAFFLVFLLAFISWHMLERPFLKRSSHYLLMKS